MAVPDLRGAGEARLLRIERDLEGMDSEIRKLKIQLRAGWEAIWDADVALAGGLPPVTPTPTPTPTATTVSGRVNGCASFAMGSGLAVVLTDPVPTTLLSTTTNSSGNWSGSISLPSGPNVNVTVTATPTSATQVTTSATYAVTPGTARPNMNVAFDPAPGFACSTMCVLPVKTSLSLAAGAACAGNTYPSDALLYQASSPPWAIGVISGAGWLGGVNFILPPVSATLNDWLYWLTLDGRLIALRDNGTGGQSFQMAAVGLSVTCGPPFSIHYVCGVSQILNAVIS